MKLHRYLQPLAVRLARALLIRALRPQLRRQLAAIFAETDATIPQALAEGAAPIVVEGLLAQAVKKATGLQATSAEAQVLGALFDVVAAAVPAANRR
jgi:hypothetical protein